MLQSTGLFGQADKHSALDPGPYPKLPLLGTTGEASLPLPNPPLNAPSLDTHATPSPRSLHISMFPLVLGLDHDADTAFDDDHSQERGEMSEGEKDDRENDGNACLPAPTLSPSRVKMGEMSKISAALLDNVLPMLATHKEALSARPKALLQGVTIRAHQLMSELAVIKLQSQFRRVLCAGRVERLRAKTRVVREASIGLLADLAEKGVVAACVSVAREVWAAHHLKDAREQEEEEELARAVESICLETCDPLAAVLVGESIQEAVDAYIRAKPKATTNPLVLVIERILEETCREMARDVARRHIQDSVTAYLEMQHAVTGFEFVARSLLEDDTAWALAIAEETLVGTLSRSYASQAAQPLILYTYLFSYHLLQLCPLPQSSWSRTPSRES